MQLVQSEDQELLAKTAADFVAEEGSAALAVLVEEAVPLLRFAIDRKLARHDLSRPEARASALRDAAQVMAAVRGSLLTGTDPDRDVRCLYQDAFTGYE